MAQKASNLPTRNDGQPVILSVPVDLTGKDVVLRCLHNEGFFASMSDKEATNSTVLLKIEKKGEQYFLDQRTPWSFNPNQPDEIEAEAKLFEILNISDRQKLVNFLIQYVEDVKMPVHLRLYAIEEVAFISHPVSNNWLTTASQLISWRDNKNIPFNLRLKSDETLSNYSTNEYAWDDRRLRFLSEAIKDSSLSTKLLLQVNRLFKEALDKKATGSE